MKLALILNVIDPKIGGVMVMGDRGTGKSTTIRALADLLPEMRVGGRECGKERWATCKSTHTPVCAGSTSAPWTVGGGKQPEPGS